MKKTLLTLAFLLAAIVGVQAQTSKSFTEGLTLTSNYITSNSQEAQVDVQFVSEKVINLVLKTLDLGGGNIVNNVTVANLQLKDSSLGAFSVFEGSCQTIVEGMGTFPSQIKGQLDSDYLYFMLKVNLETLGMGELEMEFNQSLTSKTYKDNLLVTIFSVETSTETTSEPQEAVVVVKSNEDGTLDLTLRNFMLKSGENEIAVGNIAVENLALTPSAGGSFNTFERTETIFLRSGDPSLSDFWMSTLLNDLGGVPIVMKGQINADKIHVTIDIDMSGTLQQIIFVNVGEAWEEQIPTTHTVSFVVDGQVISTQELEEGAAITVPEVEEREGYTLYWRNEIPETMPAENLEIKGEYVINQYWVDFTLDGETIYRQLQDYGSSVIIPNVEDREGYSVVWDREIPETVPAGDVLVTGKYVINQYTISYVNIIDGGYEVLFEEKVDYGSPITAPEVEEREGYTFRWLDDIPATMPAFPLMITGVYEANHYTCTWMLDGEIYAEMSIPYGEVVPDMEVQGDEHRTFSGWSDVPATMPAHDVVITGSLIDGIAGVQSSSLNTHRAYNLAGQRVDVKNVRGIVIVNGKKVVK